MCGSNLSRHSLLACLPLPLLSHYSDQRIYKFTCSSPSSSMVCSVTHLCARHALVSCFGFSRHDVPLICDQVVKLEQERIAQSNGLAAAGQQAVKLEPAPAQVKPEVKADAFNRAVPSKPFMYGSKVRARLLAC